MTNSVILPPNVQVPSARYYTRNYDYNTVFTFTSPGSITNTINLDSDSDFVWLSSIAEVFLNGTLANVSGNTLWNIEATVQLNDNSNSNIPISNQPVYFNTFFGSGPAPVMTPSPYLFRKASNFSLTVNFTGSIASGDTYLISATLRGMKRYTLTAG